MRHLLVSLAILGILASTAQARVESSCPDPCTNLPKMFVSVRETGALLAANGETMPLSAQLAAGKKHTILKIAGHIALDAGAGITGVYALPDVNGGGLVYPVARVTCVAGSPPTTPRRCDRRTRRTP